MIDTMLDDERAEKAEQILAVLFEGGAAAYFGEQVTQLEHALQTAALADGAGASDALVVAALLHDIGHLVEGGAEDVAGHGVDARHEDTGHRWLAQYFGPSVTEPIRLHVAAKRYLCALEPGYAATLSAASQVSLALQGGPMTADEVREFANGSWAAAAAQLRQWDDAAKVPGLAVPALSHYRTRIERLFESR